ncbi:hypothetical protein ACFE04_010312 [Oxalis oulophora]
MAKGKKGKKVKVMKVRVMYTCAHCDKKFDINEMKTHNDDKHGRCGWAVFVDDWGFDLESGGVVVMFVFNFTIDDKVDVAGLFLLTIGVLIWSQVWVEVFLRGRCGWAVFVDDWGFDLESGGVVMFVFNFTIDDKVVVAGLFLLTIGVLIWSQFWVEMFLGGVVVMLLCLLTIGALIWSQVWVEVFLGGVVVGGSLVFLHALLRSTDDLVMDDLESSPSK